MIAGWRRSPFGIALLAALAGTSHAAAQTPTTGSIVGRVEDTAGRVLPDALVSATEPRTGLVREAAMNARGQFSLLFLEPGEYELTVEHLGYAPRRYTGVVVRPAGTTLLTATLRAAAAAELALQADRAASPPALNAAGSTWWLGPDLVRDVPDRRRDLAGLRRLTRLDLAGTSVEGLPLLLSAFTVDGVPFRPVRLASAAAEPGLTRTGFAAAQFNASSQDIQLGGVAGSVLGTVSRSGGARATGEAAGSWAGAGLASGIEGPPPFNDLQGGIAVAGPLTGEGARFAVGLDVRRSATALSRAWPAGGAAAVVAQDGTPELQPYARSVTLPQDVLAGFARADIGLGTGQQLVAAVHAAVHQSAGALSPAGAVADWSGADVAGSVAMRSAPGGRTANELRLGVSHTSRSLEDSAGIPLTVVVDGGLSFGTADALRSGRETRAELSDALHLLRAAHVLTLGAAADISAFRYARAGDRVGRYFFGSPADFAARTGVFAGTSGDSLSADWTTVGLSAFVQDRWQLSPDLTLTAGLHAHAASLPSGVAADREWFRLTGVANDAPQDRLLQLSPRISIEWNVLGSRTWLLQAAGGLFHDRVDPLLLATWQSDDGSVRARRASGPLQWPDPGAEGGATLPRLTVLEPGFEAPRTARIDAGVSRLGAVNLHLSAALRRTENLPRRSDLNLLPLPTARDQYGRPVFGTLEQRSALLLALPGTGRRFSSYDEVAFISDDGWSTYRGVTAAMDYGVTGRLTLLARYTFSRTRDNWIGAAAGGWRVAPPVGLVADSVAAWAEGVSDLDVPHAGTVAFVYMAPAGLRLSALYRMQSGRPFTPGFREGVDADGDGGGLDPAFVDADLPGMSEQVGRWDCLRPAVGGFAARNSCRGEPVHALDVSAGFRVARVSGAAVALTADAFNVLGTEYETPDAALLLVDPEGTLSADPAARTVTVPLVVNPDFGSPLTRRYAARQIRLGISITW